MENRQLGNTGLQLETVIREIHNLIFGKEIKNKVLINRSLGLTIIEKKRGIKE